MNTSSNKREFLSRIRQALENLGAQVAIYGEDYNVIWSNDLYKEMMDSYPDGMVRECLDHLHTESGCPAFLLKNVYDAGAIQQSVFKCQYGEGETRYFKSLIFPIFDKETYQKNAIELSWYISKEAAYEIIMSGHNALLQNLANASLDAIIVLNLDNE